MPITKEEFIEFLTVSCNLSPKSIKSYGYRFSTFSKWLSKNNLTISKKSVSRFLYEQGKFMKGTSVNTYRNTLVHLDRYCKLNDLPYGFTDNTKNNKRVNPEPTVLSDEELNLLLNEHLTYKDRNGVSCSDLDFKYHTLMHFIFITGCRIEEAVSLQIKRLDIGNGRALLVDTKNNENRNLYIEDNNLKESLKKLIEGRDGEDYVFTGSTGNKVLVGTFNDDLRKRAQKAGIERWKLMHAHVLRHTYVDQLRKGGNDIFTISKLLGHKDIGTTTEYYVHFFDDELKRASRKNPFLRQQISENERIDEVLETLKKLNFENDSRFKCNIVANKGKGKFIFELKYNPQYPNVQVL